MKLKIKMCNLATMSGHRIVTGLVSAFLSTAVTAATSRNLATLADFSLEELAQIEVTLVSRRPELLSESPAAIQVITDDMIRRSGASNLPQSLRLASNLSVAQQNANEWIISARGFNSDTGNKLLVMIDGRSIYTPLFSGVSWGRQDYLLADLDRIEVVSGPGGALWGANAVNGVINIISKSAQDTQGLYMEGGGGSELEAFGAARYGDQINDKTWYRVYGKYSEHDATELSNGSEGPDPWHMGQMGFRIDSEWTDSDTLTLQGDYYDNEVGTDAVNGSVSGGNLLGRWSRELPEDANLALQVYIDRTDLDLPIAAIPGFALAGTFEEVLDTIDVDFQYQFALNDRQQLIWGLGYRHMSMDTEGAPGLGFIPEDLDMNLLSGFIQDEFAIVPDNLYLTVGTKLEDTHYSGFEIEPSVRLQWLITDRHMLWAAVSRAVRAPSRIDTDFSQPAPPNTVILQGNPDFDSETVIAYELGGRTQIGSSTAIAASVFYNEYDDIRSASITPLTILPVFFENNLEGETHGLELTINYEMTDWWQLRAGYSYLNEDIRVKPGEFDLNNALNETADPENMVSLHSSMNLPYNLEFDFSFRWIDRLPTNSNSTAVYVPQYEELDLRLGWRPSENVELSLVGQNLLHDKHLEFGTPSLFQEEVERSFYGKIVWRY